MMGRFGFALMALLAGGAVHAQGAPETAVVGAARVTLLPMEFLTPEELTALRVVLTNEEALKLFVPGAGGFAALAMSPEDGFIREGAVVKSAVALAELPDAATAAAEATKACEAAKTGAAPCVVVLTVEPAQ